MINFNYFPQSCAFCYLSKYLTTPKTVGYTDGICKSIKVEILARNHKISIFHFSIKLRNYNQ
jgi:hypothetical protein